MSINDLPEDLFHYFPLVLGATCKKFNKKINIYTRSIVVVGDPLDKNIDYSRLKYLDVSKLKLYQTAILLQKIKPYELRIKDLQCMEYMNSKKLKRLSIIYFTYPSPILTKLMDKIEITIETILVCISDIKKQVNTLNKMNIINLDTYIGYDDAMWEVENILKNLNFRSFVVGKYVNFPTGNPKYWLDRIGKKGIIIASFGSLRVSLDYVVENKTSAVLNVERYIQNFCIQDCNSLKTQPKPNFVLLGELIDKKIVEIIGDLEKIKSIYNFIEQDYDADSFLDFYKKIHNIDQEKAEE